MAFRKELEQLINKYSKENGSNTPDFILADYLNNCLINFDNALNARQKWFATNKEMWSGGLTVDENLKVEVVAKHPSLSLSLEEKIKLSEKWWNSFNETTKKFLSKKFYGLELAVEPSQDVILSMWEKCLTEDNIDFKKVELIDHPNFHVTKEEKLKAAQKWWDNLPYNESINLLAKYDKKNFSVDILEIWIEETSIDHPNFHVDKDKK